MVAERRQPTDSSPSDQPPVYRAGMEVVPGYTLIEPLGKGMAGDVWVARGAGGTRVALKIVRTLSKIGGRKELSALQTIRHINHPNLCPLHGFWLKDARGNLIPEQEDAWNSETAPKAEVLIVVMGLGDGTLHDELMAARKAAGLDKRDRKTVLGLPPGDVVRYVREAAVAIDLLNQRHRVFHRDIKPQNILLVSGGVQVCDFGVALRMEADSTHTPQLMATPIYAPPELLSERIVDRSVDSYCLAITSFELRTGTLPFVPKSLDAVVAAKKTGEFDYQAVTAPERKVYARALHPEPSQRFRSCGEFADALAVAMDVDAPRRIPIRWLVAATLSVLIAVGTPLAYWVATRPAPIDLSQRLAEVTQDYQSLSPESPYERTRDQLRSMIENLTQWATLPGADRNAIEALAKSASGNLSARLDRLVDDPGTLNASQLRLIRGDDELLRHLHQDPRRSPFRRDPEWGKRLAVRADLRGLLVGIHSLPSGDEANVDAEDARRLATLAKNVRKDLVADPERIGGVDRQRLAAVAIAVSPVLPEHRPRTLTDPASLDDLVRARAAVDAWNLTAAAPSGATAWLADRWRDLRDRPGGMIDQFRVALDSQATDSSIRQMIATHWPDVNVQSRLTALERSLVDQSWDAAATLADELRNLSPDSASEKREILLSLVGAITQPTRLDQSLTEMDARLDQAPLLAVELRGAIDAATHEASERWSASPAAANRALVDATWTAYQSLAQRLHRSVPAPIAEAVFRSVIDEPTRFYEDDPTLNFLWDASTTESSPRVNWLRAALQVEGLALAATPTRQPLAALAKALQTPPSGMAESLQHPRGYAAYVAGLASFLQGDLEDAAERWGTLLAAERGGEVPSPAAPRSEPGRGEPEITPVSETLGELRCNVLARSWLQIAIQRSGIADRDPIQLRYVKPMQPTNSDSGSPRPAPGRPAGGEGSLHPPSARQAATLSAAWLDAAGDEAPPKLRRAVWLQGLLVRVATAIEQRLKNASPPAALTEAGRGEPKAVLVTLSSLDRRVLTTGVLKCSDAVPDDAQLYRVAVELASRTRVAPEPDGSVADLDWPSLHVIGCELAMQVHEREDGSMTASIARDLLWPAASVALSLDSPSRQTRVAGRRLLVRLVNTLDDSAVTSDLDWADPDRFERLTLASSRIAQWSEADEAARWWIAAAEAMRSGIESEHAAWSAEQLDRLRELLHQAAVGSEPSREYQLLDAFELAIRGSMQPDRDDRIRLGQAAAERYRELIASLRPVDAPEAREQLYQTLWRSADTLVNLAFADVAERRRAVLLEAKRNAEEAVALYDRLEDTRDVLLNSSLWTLGNVLEDLAFYGTEPLPERHATFQDAIEKFRLAIRQTANRPREGIRNRYSLARCVARDLETCGDLVEDRAAMLAMARQQLGPRPTVDRGSPPDRMQWHLWSSRVAVLADDFAMALSDARAADAIAAESAGIIEAERDATRFWLASLMADARLADEIDLKRSRELLGTLANAQPPLAWDVMALRLNLMTPTDSEASHDWLMDPELSARLAEGQRWHPQRVLPVIALVGRRLQQAALPLDPKQTPRVDRGGAASQLARLSEACEDHPSTLALLKCYSAAVGFSPATEQVAGLLTALQGDDVDELTRLATVELLYESCLRWGSDEASSFATTFGSLTEKQRKVLEDALLHWGNQQEESRRAIVRRIVEAIRAA